VLLLISWMWWLQWYSCDWAYRPCSAYWADSAPWCVAPVFMACNSPARRWNPSTHQTSGNCNLSWCTWVQGTI